MPQSGLSPCIALPVTQNTRIQPVILRSGQPGCRRPLPGQRPHGQGTHQNSSFLLLLTGSKALQDCINSLQDHLVADLAAALAARETGVGGGTHKNNAWVWNLYVNYCDSIGLGGNYFLDDIPQQQRMELMVAFAMAVRDRQFLRPGDGPLAKKSVANTINAVAATFRRENGQEDPHRDAERNVGRLLQQQLRLYAKNNPKEKQQKALPVCVHCHILSSRSTELRRAMGKLAAAAHFWAMQLCKYSKVPKAEQQQMKQLCL